MTLRIIASSGDAYSLGRTIGEAMAGAVQQVTINNEELIATERRWIGSDYVEQLMAAALQAYPEYVRELEGMADGMGVTYERAFVWNCRGDLKWPDDVDPAEIASLGEGCTSLIIPAAGDQPAVIAHNEDGSGDFHKFCLWVTAKPEQGPGFESFLYPGMMAGHTMAANGAGIVQTINDIRVHDLKPGIPRHFICRAVLDCTTIDAAVDVLKRSDRAGGFHHNLGSVREGRLVSVEAPASGCMVKEVTAAPSAHANHLVMPEMKDKPQEITQSTAVRQKRADELLAQGALAEGGPTRILFDKVAGHEILRNPGDDSDDYNKTLATGIFELSRDGVRIALHNGPEERNIHSVHLPL